MTRSIKGSVAFILLLCTIPASVAGQTISSLHASWYGSGFHGKKMANGERFNMYDNSIVAHKSLPFGTRLRITNPKTNISINAVVKDRGPYIRGRDIDLSRAGAEALGFLDTGTAHLIVQEQEATHHYTH